MSNDTTALFPLRACPDLLLLPAARGARHPAVIVPFSSGAVTVAESAR